MFLKSSESWVAMCEHPEEDNYAMFPKRSGCYFSDVRWPLPAASPLDVFWLIQTFYHPKPQSDAAATSKLLPAIMIDDAVLRSTNLFNSFLFCCILYLLYRLARVGSRANDLPPGLWISSLVLVTHLR